MKHVTACNIGIVVLDEDMELADYSLFPRDAETVQERLHVLDKGMSVPELDEVLEEVDEEVATDLEIDDSKRSDEAKEHVENNLEELALETGFVESEEGFKKFMAEMARLETEEKLRAEDRDRYVSQAVAAVDDLIELTNKMSERLHEWYGLYHPELEAEDNREYAEAVAEGVDRAGDSVGSDASPEDLEAIRTHAERTAELFRLKEELEQYIERTMEDMAPNMAAVGGPVLSARLINQAGSLEKLAKMPSSTIQMLGAEKALFSYMKAKKKGKDAKPPKHGLIFTHPMIQKVSEDKHGKMARAIAAKMSMAAKTDFYTGKDRTERYTEELQEKFEEINTED